MNCFSIVFLGLQLESIVGGSVKIKNTVHLSQIDKAETGTTKFMIQRKTMQHLKNEVPGLLESEPFCRIEFNFQISMSGTVTIHMADCGTATTIGGLKEDLKSLFGAPSVQEWYLRSTMLQDDRTLESYGIDGRERRTAKIYVKQTSH